MPIVINGFEYTPQELSIGGIQPFTASCVQMCISPSNSFLVGVYALNINCFFSGSDLFVSPAFAKVERAVLLEAGLVHYPNWPHGKFFFHTKMSCLDP